MHLYWKKRLESRTRTILTVVPNITPHATTGISPASALFNHHLKNGILNIQNAILNVQYSIFAKYNNNIQLGQHVLCKNFKKTSYMDVFYKNQPYIVEKVNKHSYTITIRGKSITRAKAHLKPYNRNFHTAQHQHIFWQPHHQPTQPSSIILIELEEKLLDNKSEPSTILYDEISSSENEGEEDQL